MKKFLASAAIGVTAGIIDVVPMLLQDLDRFACLSAFVHWVVLGVVICYVKVTIPSWLKGLSVGVAGSLSVVLIVAKVEPQSILPILGMSAFLGTLVGVLSAKFVH